MEKGKFSQPRPYRDEERQIEEAFRQVTAPKKRKNPSPDPAPGRFASAPEDTVILDPPLTQPEPIPEPVQPAQPEVIPEESAPSERRGGFSVKKFLFEEEMDFSEEEPEAVEESLPEDAGSALDRIYNFCMDNRKWILVGLCALALVLLISVIAVFAVGASDRDDDTVAGNVYIANVNINGMTKKQAISAVERATDNAYAHNDMVVDLAGTRLTLSPEDTGAKLDVPAAVNAAFALDVSEDQQYIALLPYLELDTDFIRQTLDAYAGGAGSTLTQASYGLEGSYPSLNAENFDKNAAQTLVLTMGTPGISFDVDTVYDQILDAYSLFSFLVTVEDVQSGTEPDPVDLQAIYEEFYVAPVDSTVDMQTFEVIPGSYGYEFDLEAAQKLVDNAQFGDVIRIPMVFIEPELLDEDILFRDVLGESQTALTSDRNRTCNVRLACEEIDGIILQPGDTFSFNHILGNITANKGYKTVTEVFGNDTVETLGGGISQCATTLYQAALLADLEIVTRTNHSFLVSYADYGMDAYAGFGGSDFKFRNNSNYPLQIHAQVSGSYVTIQLMGTDERDYYVKMDYTITATQEPATEYEDFEHNNPEGYLDGDVIRKGITGYSVKIYKLKYSRETGDLMSRDYEASSRYSSVNRLVARVEEPETTLPPETTVPPTTVPPTEETVPPTTVPAETIPPETKAPAEEETLPSESVQTEDLMEAA